MYPLCLIPKEILVPSEYNKFVDAIGIATPVPETVLTVKLNKDADLSVASSTIKTLSAESGIVTVLFAVKVPVSLKYKFLPLDTAPLDKANATSDEPTSIAMYPDTACSNCCKLVLVIVPQVPDFSPVGSLDLLESKYQLLLELLGSMISHLPCLLQVLILHLLQEQFDLF